MPAHPAIPLVAFLDGTAVPIEEVPDPVFAGRMMGDGIAIAPAAGGGARLLCAPCAGTVVQIHNSRHACIIETDAGVRLLLHIGMDTVLLKGEGFAPCIAAGDRVEAGDPLIEFQPETLARHGKPAITVLAVENGELFPISWRSSAQRVAVGDPLLLLEKKEHVPPAGAAVPGIRAQGGETAIGWTTVRHAGGLHARPCALLANALKPFAAQVELLRRGATANARSATAVMGLAVGENDAVEIHARGPGAGDALEVAIAALQTRSGPAAKPAAAVPSTAPLRPGELAGVPASPGLAIGRIVHLRRDAGPIPETGAGEAAERQAFEAALQAARGEIDAAVADARRRGEDEQADIFAAHRVLCDDPELLDDASARLAAGHSAAFAWHGALDRQCAALQKTGNALLVGRINDLRDVERQVLRRLLPQGATAAPATDAQSVLVADDLLPSDFRWIKERGAAALLTVLGGPTSHAAILARAAGIPAIVALGPAVLALAAGAWVVVDADAGRVETAPDARRLAEIRAAKEERAAKKTAALAAAQDSAETTDGVRIEVAANVTTVAEAREAAACGADGVGLLRTELLFIERDTAPSVAEQQASYQAIVDALAGQTVIIRTLDVGADKNLAYVAQDKEDNPALGLRGIRLGLQRESLLTEQLQAVLALRPAAAVRVMLPMVSDREEVVAVRARLRHLAQAAGSDAAVELGIMIETPAAALLADQLAEVADFFSIGTNDLTQYTLCMDRTNPALAARIDAFHPAVLRLIAQTGEGAARHARPVAVCGAMASDFLAVPLLIGYGVRELSVAPAAVPEIKAAVRRLALADCRRVAEEALRQPSADAVRRLARDAWPWLDRT